MFPVFSLVLDKDVKSEVAMLYPELYKDLLKVPQIFPVPPSRPPSLGLLPSFSPCPLSVFCPSLLFSLLFTQIPI
jgi:hypothetical protein